MKRPVGIGLMVCGWLGLLMLSPVLGAGDLDTSVPEPEAKSDASPTADGPTYYTEDESSDDSTNLSDPYELFGTTDNGHHVGGWMQSGYHSQSNGLFNNHDGNLNMQQFWLYAEKKADGSNGLGWGYRVDSVFGVDAQDTQAFGNNPGRFDFQNGFDHGIFGWAIPQAYVEVAHGDWSIKAGHFFTIVGYEVVTAPDNFFYSHAYTMYNSEPFTHTGVLTTYSGMEDVVVYAGWTLGWDTGFDRFGKGSSFLGGFSLSLTDDTSIT